MVHLGKLQTAFLWSYLVLSGSQGGWGSSHGDLTFLLWSLEPDCLLLGPLILFCCRLWSPESICESPPRLKALATVLRTLLLREFKAVEPGFFFGPGALKSFQTLRCVTCVHLRIRTIIVHAVIYANCLLLLQ